MIKCPYCHSSNSAMVHEFEPNCQSKGKRVVSYKRNGKTVLVATNERLCVDCGGIFVAKKDCHKIKASIDRARENAEDMLKGATYV